MPISINQEFLKSSNLTLNVARSSNKTGGTSLVAKIGINGFGRMGRLFMRAGWGNDHYPQCHQHTTHRGQASFGFATGANQRSQPYSNHYRVGHGNHRYFSRTQRPVKWPCNTYTIGQCITHRLRIRIGNQHHGRRSQCAVQGRIGADACWHSRL